MINKMPNTPTCATTSLVTVDAYWTEVKLGWPTGAQTGLHRQPDRAGQDFVFRPIFRGVHRCRL